MLRLLDHRVVDHSAVPGRGPPSVVVGGPVQGRRGGLRHFEEDVGEVGQSPVQRGTNGVGVMTAPPTGGPFGEFVERVGLCGAFPRQGRAGAPCEVVAGHGGVAGQRPEVGGAQVVDRVLKLFLSPRTVGSHLYRVFPKLGITARSQLRDVLEGTLSDNDARS